MRRTVVFKDGEGHRVSVTFELTKKDRNARDWDTLEKVTSYKSLSVSGNMSSGAGQIDYAISPATESQKKLLEMWRQYHLNDCQAGTKRQKEYFESDAYKRVVDLFDNVFTNSSVWNKSVEKFDKSHFEAKYPFRVNRGRGCEILVKVDKDMNVKCSNFGQSLTKDDVEYAREQIRKKIELDRRELFDSMLAKCIFEFIFNYPSDVTLNHISAVSDEEFLRKSFREWYDRDTMKLLKNVPYDYDFRKLALKLDGLFSDKGYLYGTDWLLKRLPDDIEDQINKLCDDIERENEERALSIADKMESVEGIDWSKSLSEIGDDEDSKYLSELAVDIDEKTAKAALALGKALGESAAEIVDSFDVADGDCKYRFGADEYYIGDSDELTEIARADMKSCYRDIWVESVKSGNTDDSFNDWIDDVLSNDGFATILDHYDGSGMSANVDGTTYYICRP